MSYRDSLIETLNRIESLLAQQTAELLGREQLATLCSLSLRTIDQMAATPGKLPEPLRFGTRKLWRRKDIMKWLDKQ